RCGGCSKFSPITSACNAITSASSISSTSSYTILRPSISASSAISANTTALASPPATARCARIRSRPMPLRTSARAPDGNSTILVSPASTASAPPILTPFTVTSSLFMAHRSCFGVSGQARSASDIRSEITQLVHATHDVDIRKDVVQINLHARDEQLAVIHADPRGSLHHVMLPEARASRVLENARHHVDDREFRTPSLARVLLQISARLEVMRLERTRG